MSLNEGWVCPVCKTVYAPWVGECSRCGGVDKVIKVEPYLWNPNKAPYYIQPITCSVEGAKGVSINSIEDKFATKGCRC